MKAQLIDKEKLNSMLSTHNFELIDLREKISNTKIANAVKETPENFDSWKEKYNQDQTLILYCDSDDTNVSNRAAHDLEKLGFESIYILKGGWKEWRAAGYPTEEIGGGA